jgi:hypothetical protein
MAPAKKQKRRPQEGKGPIWNRRRGACTAHFHSAAGLFDGLPSQKLGTERIKSAPVTGIVEYELLSRLAVSECRKVGRCLAPNSAEQTQDLEHEEKNRD